MTSTPTLTVSPVQERLMDMHTVLNLLNIIVGELHLMQMKMATPELLEPPIEKVMQLKKLLHSTQRDDYTPAVMQDFKDSINAALKLAESMQPGLSDNEEYQAIQQHLQQLFTLFDIRMDELLTRWAMPDRWEVYTVKSFKKDFKHFLSAVENYAKGTYRIIYNIAEQTHKDYLVHLNVTTSRDDEIIYFPLLFKDVMRDLVSNARKYTLPGGQITIGFFQSETAIKFVVEDTGLGIPEEELDRVLAFGYRASNVENKRTMGGGFGLTKALYVTQHFDGVFDIQSEEGVGTRVTITLPLPEEKWDD